MHDTILIKPYEVNDNLAVTYEDEIIQNKVYIDTIDDGPIMTQLVLISGLTRNGDYIGSIMKMQTTVRL